MPTPRPIFRFAPSPNGPLHRGHALSALLNARLAERHNGLFFLRIEDIDIGRSRDTHIQSIGDDLDWLGLDWPKPVRRQSEHMQDYARAIDVLMDQDLIYPCFCSRRDVANRIAELGGEAFWPSDPDGGPIYPGTCRDLAQNDIAERIDRGAIPLGRLKMDDAIRLVGRLMITLFNPATLAEHEIARDPSVWGDVVLVRRDTPSSYHLSVVVDDALQGVTHIVRGKDLEAATSIHVLLQRILDVPSPAYWHHSLILDEGGEKLAKSRTSRSLRDEIDNGLTPDNLIGEFIRSAEFTDLLNFENEEPKRG